MSICKGSYKPFRANPERGTAECPHCARPFLRRDLAGASKLNVPGHSSATPDLEPGQASYTFKTGAL